MKKKPSRQGRNRSHSPHRRKPRASLEVRVLYEDDAVIAIDKPAGLPAVPVAKNSRAPSAFSLLVAEMKEQRQRAYVVHRIDRYTSGILLFAKTARDREALVNQFLEHRPLREYLAVVRGQLEKESGTLVHYFRKEGQVQKLSAQKDPKAARAEMQFKLERRLRDASLVRVALITGLQNQIRVQFSAIGHPVIGDRKYHPDEAEERRIDRVALHASRLEFVHPRTREKVVVESDVPNDLQQLVKGLQGRR
jgi:23S rRNA pseudouridine1911/1915/1917 synthase